MSYIFVNILLSTNSLKDMTRKTILKASAPYVAPECESTVAVIDTAVLVGSTEFGEEGNAGKDIEIEHEYIY